MSTKFRILICYLILTYFVSNYKSQEPNVESNKDTSKLTNDSQNIETNFPLNKADDSSSQTTFDNQLVTKDSSNDKPKDNIDINKNIIDKKDLDSNSLINPNQTNSNSKDIPTEIKNDSNQTNSNSKDIPTEIKTDSNQTKSNADVDIKQINNDSTSSTSDLIPKEGPKEIKPAGDSSKNVENKPNETSTDLNNNKKPKTSDENNEEDEQIEQIAQDQSNEDHKPPVPSGINPIIGGGNKEKTEKKNVEVDEYEEEDNIAKNAFIITLLVLIVFVFVFIYNLIKCYAKLPSDNGYGSTDNSNQNYSRESQDNSINDDTVIDLSH